MMVIVRLECEDMECGRSHETEVTYRHWMAGASIVSYLPEGWKVVEADVDEAITICPKHAEPSERRPTPYPPNTKCVCGDLIHPDQPFVEVEADGGLFHWNEDGGGHRANARMT